MPTALIKTRGRRQYPRTLAVRRKLTPVSDMRFRIQCNETVPRRMNPYTYPKWLLPLLIVISTGVQMIREHTRSKNVANKIQNIIGPKRSVSSMRCWSTLFNGFNTVKA